MYAVAVPVGGRGNFLGFIKCRLIGYKNGLILFGYIFGCLAEQIKRWVPFIVNRFNAFFGKGLANNQFYIRQCSLGTVYQFFIIGNIIIYSSGIAIGKGMPKIF
jgi:hypothetical protein